MTSNIAPVDYKGGMNDFITPLKFLITVAGWWVNEWQAKRIEFLCE